MFAWIGAITVGARSYLIKRAHLKRRLRYRYEPGDIEWDERATVVVPGVCVAAGICAGMFGIGGGE